MNVAVQNGNDRWDCLRTGSFKTTSRETHPLKPVAEVLNSSELIRYEVAMQHDLPIGLALRRFRRLNGIKQGDIAQRLSVNQGSVSRWESGVQEPDAGHRERIAEIVAASATSASDAALKRLVSTSSLPVHLICDATHRLLAASPTRAASWNVDVAFYLG